MSAKELSRGEKAAVSRAVHAGKEPNIKDPDHQGAAKAYAKEVKAEMKGQGGHKAHAEPEEEHKRGELTQGEKSAVSRAVHGGKPVEELPFVQGHKVKLQRAQEYAGEVKPKK